MMNLYNLMILFLMILDLTLMLFLIIPSFFFKFQPLVLSLILLFYSLILVLKLMFFSNSSWMSYILFLLMVGGLMILILYLTSISNNELFLVNLFYYLYMYIKFMFILVITYYLIKIMGTYNYYITMIFNDLLNFELNLIFFMKFLYSYMFMVIYIFLYLFLLMIVSVMICSKKNIPFRQMLKYE